jgi:hypothetical protein
MSFCRQLKALIKKNMILKRRSLIFSIIEIIYPLICVILFVFSANKTNAADSLVSIVFTIPICFAMACRYILSQVVYEKEMKMKETMKIMSLRTLPYGMTFFISQTFFTILASVMITIAFYIKKMFVGDKIMPFYFTVLLFGMAITSFSLTLTAFFSDSKLSTQIGSLVILIPMAVFLALYQNHQNILPYLYWIPHFPMSVLVVNIVIPGTIIEMGPDFA